MHADVAAVIEELDAHRARFEELCRSLSDEELIRPVPQSDWLVRDFIAHLATIDGPIVEMFESINSGRDPGIRTGDGQRWDVDIWNEGQVQKRRALSVDELLSQAAATRAPLRESLMRMDERALASTLKFGGDSKRPPAEIELRRYLRGWCKHDPMHAVDMLRALPDRLTADVQQWIDDPVVQGYQQMMNRS
jgi:hypothetical protein